MKKTDVLTIVKNILADFSDAPLSEISESSQLSGDLGLNSLDVINIVIVFEERFSVSIPDHDLSTLKTVHDVVDYLYAKV